MTKKRIADLLKEEVEKPTEEDSVKTSSDTTNSAAKKFTTATDSATEASSETKSRTRKRASATASTAKSSSANATVATATAAKSAAKKVESKPAVSDKKVVELEAALKKSAAQVSALQEDVETHQERVFELKDSLQSAQSESKTKDTQLKKLTVELEVAKQTILKLTEANKEKETLAIASKSAAPKAPEKSPEKSPEKETSKPAERQISVYRRPYTSYKSIPEYAIQRGTPASGQNTSMMDDDDIGWVD